MVHRFSATPVTSVTLMTSMTLMMIQGVFWLLNVIFAQTAIASPQLFVQQSSDNSPTQGDLLPNFGDDPIPTPELTPLPPVDDLFETPETKPTPNDPSALRFIVNQVVFEGNTVFTDEELATVIPDGIMGESVTITRLYDIRSAVAAKYIDAGYATSGAFLPEQRIQDGIITIEVVEGTLTAIDIRGNEELKDRYIEQRIWQDIDTPLNVNNLLDTLRLIQLDPRISTLSAELRGGVHVGESFLAVDVVEGDTFDVVVGLDNGRSPSVGSFRQTLSLNLLNVNGYGETFDVTFAHTSGSVALDGRIGTFLNARNGTLELRGGVSNSEVIEDPFEVLNLESEAFFTELTYRQPILQTLTDDIALGITASHQQTRSIFDLPESLGGEVPLTSFGADNDGVVRVSALRFFQEWNRRRSQHLLAARSQLSIGLDALDSTVNNDGRPDSRFVAWRGQAQWARLLAEDTLLLVKGDLQFADDDLLSLEQFGLGGQSTIRGYRQDILLTDNGFLASAEARFPIAKAPPVNGVLHLIPFLDVGKGWNWGDDDPDPSTLVGTGLGVQWQQDALTARIDVGLPLVDVRTRDDNSLQEMGIYMSLEWEAF